MTKATLNVQHEYITQRTVWHKKPLCSMNLTTSYSGEKCTASGVEGETMKRIWRAFLAHRKLIGSAFQNNGDQMDALRKIAEQSTDPANFAALLEGNVAIHKGTPKAEAPKAEPKKEAPAPRPHVNAYDAGEQQQPTQEALEAAFNLVKNKKDWKARIDARINKKDEAIVLAAIIHFTGTAGYTLPHPTNPDKLIVRAKGYRMGPCGDH